MAGTNNTDTETPLTPATASDICRRIGLGMTRGKKMDSLKAGSWLLKVAEFIAAQQQEIERMRKMHERNVINNCDVIRRALIVGLGYPDTVDGKCGGYAMSETDDEPHDSCKNCLAGVDSEEAWEAATHD